MSFQYPYIEHYSPAPATPLDAFAAQRWDHSAQDGVAQLVSPASCDYNITQHQQQDTLTPVEAQNASSTAYEPPQVIQLVERPPRRVRQQVAMSQSQAQNPTQASPNNQKRSQVRSQAHPQSQNQPQALSHTSPNLNTQASAPRQRHQRTLSSVPPPGQWFNMHGLANATSDKRPATASAAARTQARLATHPYRRTVSGPESIGVNNTSLKTQMRISKNSVMAGGNLLSHNNTNCDPICLKLTKPDGLVPPYAIVHNIHNRTCTSTRFYLRLAVTNTVTAMLELPGVKSAHVRVGLNICPHTHIKQLVVRGRSQPLLPDRSVENSADDRGGGADGKKKVEGYIVRERKVGEFKRVLVVPPETKRIMEKFSRFDIFFSPITYEYLWKTASYPDCYLRLSRYAPHLILA
ncbi:hypothetical protein EW145_g5190 [Phellinidium pouzarii]|uniref:Uncharacterized protein n=1 Tax=Phellinidium pouzarii TaxID=167371 RepID=A0A4S4L2R9_9AGAM|nr:hypothetical protein EW145_g5190 [Phellinidium pouzarii]